MAEVALNIDELTVPEVISVGSQLVEGLRNNEHFSNPTPSLGELQAIVGELAEAQEHYRKLQLQLGQFKTTRDVIVAKLKRAIASEAAYVQEASEGDAKKIMSANLHFGHKVSFWPFGGLGKVIELSASAGDESGEVDLGWDRVRGADGYEVEISRESTGAGSWESAAATTKSKTTVQHLNSRQRYWFRVRAVNEGSTGDWSDPITKLAR